MGRVLVALMCLLAGTGVRAGTVREPVTFTYLAQIDTHIRKADYILVTHGHIDHMLDAPYISNKTGAVIICTQSHANIARAYGVPEERLIVVLGGEDYQFEGFSLRILPSIHSPLWNKGQ